MTEKEMIALFVQKNGVRHAPRAEAKGHGSLHGAVTPGVPDLMRSWVFAPGTGRVPPRKTNA